MSAGARSPTPLRQVAGLTLVAVVLLVGLRVLRGGPKLSHMDFVSGGPGSLEFCDAANPRFLPVVARASPVVLVLRTAAPAVANLPVDVGLTLTTNTGKPIGPAALLLTGTQKLALLIVDPALADFQAVAAESGRTDGVWTFRFTPHRHGLYRVFADFTPRATDQEMYGSADLPVDGDQHVHQIEALRATPADVFEIGGLRLTLESTGGPIRAREPAELDLTVQRLDGTAVRLRAVDGAPARLTAFDQDRTGFVNLRPAGPRAPVADGAEHLIFRVTLADPGQYVFWARVDAGSGAVAAPFALAVRP
jgi:hypothetical protein